MNSRLDIAENSLYNEIEDFQKDKKMKIILEKMTSIDEKL